MKILRELTRLQHELGYLDESTLRDVAKRLRVPLYRIEGLVSFYPSFQREPPFVPNQKYRCIQCSLNACRSY